MLNAFVLGAVSQLSLILSGLTVFLVSVPKRLVGALAAFGAGALIAAVARDLLPEAHVLQLAQASLWAMLGAVAFIVGERYVDRKFGSEGAAGALGIVVGAVVDGVPDRSSLVFSWRAANRLASLSSRRFLCRTFRKRSRPQLTWVQPAGTGGESPHCGAGLLSHAASLRSWATAG
jgi:hypothetical protein